MNTYKRHRFPSYIISHSVWLYHRFNLSHRYIEELLAERGITVSREAIRLWYPPKVGAFRRSTGCAYGQAPSPIGIKFGAIYARRLKLNHLVVELHCMLS